MKGKSVLAGLAACVIAAAAAVFPASAELMSKTGNDKDAEIYFIPADGLDLSGLDKIVAEISLDAKMLNGTIGYNEIGAGWKQNDQELRSDSGPTTGEWTVSGLDGRVQDGLQVQFWWVDARSDGSTGTAKLESVRLYDKNGRELGTAGSGQQQETTVRQTEAKTEAQRDETKPETGTEARQESTVRTDGTKAETEQKDEPSSDAGDAGVGTAAACLAAAGAAAFLSRKKH